jgi:RNA polymerase sigma factor (sigma-70 family)
MPDPHFQTLHHPNPKALRDLMDTLFPLIAHLVQSNSGTHEDAEDVFMYGMGELFFKAQQGTLRQDAKLSTILYAICRNYWLKTLKKNKPTAELTIDLENVYTDDNPEDEESWERIHLIRRQMAHISETCRKLLELVFHTDLDMRQIAKQMNLTYGSARVRKSECIARLRALFEKAVAENALND